MKRVKTKRNRMHMSPEEKVKYLENEIKIMKDRRGEEIALMAETIFAIEIIDLWTVLGWREKRVSERLFSQLLIFSELSEGRNTPVGILKDAKWHSGIDLVELIKDLSDGKEVTEERIVEMIKKNRRANEYVD